MVEKLLTGCFTGDVNDLKPQNEYDQGEIEDTLRLYFKEIRSFPLLTSQEEVDLAKRIKDGDLKARKRFIEGNLRMAIAVASRYQGRGLDLPDLIQAANCGLMISVEKFDPERGFKFSTYAWHWIRQTVVRTLAEQSRTRRISVHNYELLGKAFKITRDLWQKLGRDPTNTEVAQNLGIPLERLEKVLTYISPDFSLEAQITDNPEDARTWEDILPSLELSTEDQVDQLLLKRAVGQALETLPERNRRILELRFGIDGRPRTLDEIGQEVGVTRERVRQVIEEIIKNWRDDPPEVLKKLA